MADWTSYYFDLRDKATVAGSTPACGEELLRHLTADPERANPVDVVQAGLGAWQLGESWTPVVASAVAWVERTADDRGRLLYRFAMPHTFPLAAPWCSALAQGEAASLLVRAAQTLGRPELSELAARLIGPLLVDEGELVTATAEGPVLQEYPTDPPAHVLNGWITALWGLYDASAAGIAGAREAFESGVTSLEARLHLYETYVAWSRYDLFPHPLVNVASPSYHRLHAGHLRALDAIAHRPAFAETAGRWQRSSESGFARTVALARKALFRAVRPRRRLVS